MTLLIASYLLLTFIAMLFFVPRIVTRMCGADVRSFRGRDISSGVAALLYGCVFMLAAWLVWNSKLGAAYSPMFPAVVGTLGIVLSVLFLFIGAMGLCRGSRFEPAPRGSWPWN